MLVLPLGPLSPPSSNPSATLFHRQMESIDPVQLRVRLASGGDPTFPLTIRLSGEHVAGTSGSFREFLARMVKDVQGPALSLLMECPSAGVGQNKGMFILRSGPVSYPTVKLLEFFGKLLGVALRADVPLALDLLPSFWKSLVGQPLDAGDVLDADWTTGKQLLTLENMTNEAELETYLLALESPLVFSVHSLDARDVVHLSDCATSAPLVTWANHRAYIDAVRQLRVAELQNTARIAAIRRGLASVIPLDTLTYLSWQVCLQDAVSPSVD